MAAVFFLCGLGSLLACPWTKVEESFATDLAFDVASRAPLWTHEDFFGPVPKSGLVPATLALTLRASRVLPLPEILVVYRLVVLALFTLAASRCRSHRLFWVLASCFHFTFYASRPLHNTFATATTLLALSNVCTALGTDCSRPQRAAARATVWLALTAGCLRVDQAAFAATLAAVLAVCVSWFHVLLGAFVGAVLVGFSICFDTILWGSTPHSSSRWLVWPELQSLLFNSDNSSAWGTSPAYWYPIKIVESLGPHLLAALVVLEPMSARKSKSSRLAAYLAVPVVVNIVALSLLPHKEVRFILPQLAVFAAIASFSESPLGWLLALPGFAISLVKHACSVFNYPGGWALHSIRVLTGRSFSSVLVRVHSRIVRVLLATGLLTWPGGKWRYLDLSAGFSTGTIVVSREATHSGAVNFLLGDMPVILENRLCDPETLRPSSRDLPFLFERAIDVPCQEATWVVARAGPPTFRVIAEIPQFRRVRYWPPQIELETGIKLFAR